MEFSFWFGRKLMTVFQKSGTSTGNKCAGKNNWSKKNVSQISRLDAMGKGIKQLSGCSIGIKSQNM